MTRHGAATMTFLASALVLTLFAWDRAAGPSPQFHFLDLANSLLTHRLDTDTPRRRKGQRPRPGDPPGLQAAVNRQLGGQDGQGGWNDWASIHVITLKGGTVVKGVFPWSDQQGDARKRFVTTTGQRMVIDRHLDVEKGCGVPGVPCDKVEYFVSFPPFPSIVLTPLFLAFAYNVNDVVFTAINAAFNASVFFLLLEYLVSLGLSRRTRRENLLLTLFFTFGTVNFFSSIRGEVWFTAQIIGITLNLLYILAAIEARHPFLAGLCLGVGMATRTPIAFAFPFFGLELLRRGGHLRLVEVRTCLRKAIIFAAPVLAVGFVLMAYNHARFDNPFEFGHTFLAGGTRPSIRDHGLFSFWFLRHNLAAALTNPPVIDGVAPFIHITRHGLGLLWTSPLLLLLLWPGRMSMFAKELLITALIVAIPSLFYQNTGWEQFSYRFALDYLPYLVLVLTVTDRPFDRKFYVLLAVSLVMNAFGALTFGRMRQFYYD